MKNKEQIFEIIKELLLNHLTIDVIDSGGYVDVKVKLEEDYITSFSINKHL